LHKPIFAGKNLLLPAKSVFATAVFTMEKTFFPPSGKNLPTPVGENEQK